MTKHTHRDGVAKHFYMGQGTRTLVPGCNITDTKSKWAKKCFSSY